MVQFYDGGELPHAGVLRAAVTLWNQLTCLDERLSPYRCIGCVLFLETGLLIIIIIIIIISLLKNS